MARIFTTFFRYKGANYTAIITQKKDCTSIKLLDEAMHPILPDGGEVSFPQGPGLEVGPGQLVQTQNLIAALMAAAEADGPFQSNDHSLDKSDPFG